MYRLNKMNLIPGNLITRKNYIGRIEPFIGKNIIKVLTGQRRVGKSYQLYQIMDYIMQNDINANIIYINKEDLAYDNIKSEIDLNEYVMANLGKNCKNYLFIDEVQEIYNFEKALRSLLLNEDTDIYCTGSNAGLLSGELATLLGGRYIAFNVHSLSYKEFLMFHGLEDSEISLDKYIKYGGLPYLRNLEPDDDIVFEYLKNIYSSIVYRDVVARYNIRNTGLLERLVQFLADYIGSLFSAKKISDYLKSQKINLSPNLVLTYIDYLSRAFLIYKADRYDIIGKKIFNTGGKYYFENLGIRNAIIGYKPNDRGKLLENLVYNHLISNEYSVRTGYQDRKEIDFICEKRGEKLYLQVALKLDDENTIEREFGNLLSIKDNYPKQVITMDNFTGNSHQGVEHVNIRKFLMS
jgi:uncharacterized protein